MTTPYAGEGETDARFADTAFLVLLNRLTSLVVAGLLLCGDTGGASGASSFVPVAPLSSYLAIAASNFLATFCQYEALKHLSFPTQTLGKCSKIVPVMLLGMLRGKKYGWTEWAAVTSISLGSFLFLVSGDISSASNPGSDTPMGLVLLVVYLFFDGFTSTSQERLFRGYGMSASHQMFFVGGFSALISVFCGYWPVLRGIDENGLFAGQPQDRRGLILAQLEILYVAKIIAASAFAI